MVVDDDPNLRRIYHDVLTAHGYSVIVAKSGEECLALLHRTVPKVLVLDIMMPEMDGIETCKRARKMVGESVPILFLDRRRRDGDGAQPASRPAATTT